MQREFFEKIFNTGTLWDKQEAVQRFLVKNAKTSDYHYIFNKIQSLKREQNSHSKIAILSSFTLDQLKQILEVELFSRGKESDVYLAGYNQYQQEILVDASPMYKFSPSIVIIAIRMEELFNDFYWAFNTISSQQLKTEEQRILELFESLIETLKSKCSATIIVNNFSQPQNLVNNIYDPQDLSGQVEWLKAMNTSLQVLANKYSGTYLFDLDRNLYEFGVKNAYDSKMWYCASIPYKKNFIIHLAANYSQYIMSLHGRKKCLVLDLDNVLWGGIIGEDGLDRIALGKDYPGNVYVDIQRLIKLFSQQGVILALNSKNNEADVKEVFQNHPEMVLKWDDFAAARVNWNPKPQNFVELAKEINIGLDSMVFVDDSPFETQMVNKLLPEVEIIQFGENPLENLQVIRETESFNFLSLTKEDLKKNEQYKAEARRKHLKKNIASIEEFYFTLEMKIKIHECDSFALTRAVQLIQKTNQFNLTTRRYSESDIEGFCNSDYHHIYTMSVSDKYGDFGIVGILITQVLKNDWLIDTFLLSCRIIGRDLETAFLSYVLEEARKYSAKRLIGKYIPTLKNKQVSDLYSKYAFTKVNGEFFLNTDKVILFPSWIELIKE